jgi:hypothetical protein
MRRPHAHRRQRPGARGSGLPGALRHTIACTTSILQPFSGLNLSLRFLAAVLHAGCCRTCAEHATALCAQVYNLTTYPNLVGLLETLGVDTEPSDMSFALSSDNGTFEWGSRSLAALFCQRRNLISPTFWRMVADVVRFGRGAREVTLCRAFLNRVPSPQPAGPGWLTCVFITHASGAGAGKGCALRQHVHRRVPAAAAVQPAVRAALLPADVCGCLERARGAGEQALQRAS